MLKIYRQSYEQFCSHANFGDKQLTAVAFLIVEKFRPKRKKAVQLNISR
jgi:hypothetical protein